MKGPCSRTVLGLVRKAFGLGVVLTALACPALAHHGSCHTSVPEIDPGSALSASALLGGGLMMLTDRRRPAPR